MSSSIDLIWLQSQFPELSGLQKIGKGGQKLVFAGTHRADGPVMLKFYNLSIEPERVKREVDAASQIGASRIPKVLRSGILQLPVGNFIWIQEERVPGESLRDVLSSGALPPESLMRISLHLLQTLAAAEHARIVHRDVKPENIVIDPDGAAWLIDFGLARYLDRTSLTATAARFGCGTAGYAPPEQFRNFKSSIDSRADLFGLGVTLYECAEGRNPYLVGARDVGEILRRVETQPLPAVSRVVDSCGAFNDLVMAMTRLRPDQRLPTAADALQWAEEICAREGVQ
jgi:serine/threonine-protein kinase